MKKFIQRITKFLYKTKTSVVSSKNSRIPKNRIEINNNNLHIDNFVSIGPDCKFNISENTGIYIGKGTIIDPKCTFLTRSHAFNLDDLTSIPYDNRSFEGDIHIGKGVWIGEKSFILPGVIIGDGAVVGAMTIVSKNVPKCAVVVGNPARIINYRNADKYNELLDSDSFILKNYNNKRNGKIYINKIQTETTKEKL
jgi:acetyltransferase-like isoleucine patch superfamily enzyme